MQSMRNQRIVDPAGPGEAHLTDDDGQTLCGRDGRLWRQIKSPPWDRLGMYRCPRCLESSAERS
jgi:hypothetical protein